MLTSMSVSDWHMSKQKVYNWPSNKSEFRPHHDRIASSPPSHAIRYKLGPQNNNHGPTAVIHLRPTSDWPVMLCDQLATNLPHGRDRLELPVSLGKSLHELKMSRVTYDRFTTVPNEIRGHRVNCDQSAMTCDQRRIQLRVESLEKWYWHIPRPFVTAESDRRACPFQ